MGVCNCDHAQHYKKRCMQLSLMIKYNKEFPCEDPTNVCNNIILNKAQEILNEIESEESNAGL